MKTDGEAPVPATSQDVPGLHLTLAESLALKDHLPVSKFLLPRRMRKRAPGIIPSPGISTATVRPPLPQELHTCRTPILGCQQLPQLYDLVGQRLLSCLTGPRSFNPNKHPLRELLLLLLLYR